MGDWYILDKDKLKALNAQRAYEKVNVHGRKYLLRFKLMNTRQENAKIFIEAGESIYSAISTVLAREDANYMSNWLPETRLMQNRIDDYITSFRFAFDLDVCKERTEELPQKLCEVYNELIYFIKRLSIIDKGKENVRQQKEERLSKMRCEIEHIVKMEYTEERQLRFSELIHNYEQMAEDPHAKHFLQWKKRREDEISKWVEKGKKRVEEEERHKLEKEYKRHEENVRKELERHEVEIREIKTTAIIDKKVIELEAERDIRLNVTPAKCPPLLYCSTCNYTAPSQSVFKKHMNTKKHTQPRPSYICDPCGVALRDKTDYDRHLVSKKHQLKGSQ